MCTSPQAWLNTIEGATIVSVTVSVIGDRLDAKPELLVSIGV